jgi:hypothetical protein
MCILELAQAYRKNISEIVMPAQAQSRFIAHFEEPSGQPDLEDYRWLPVG